VHVSVTTRGDGRGGFDLLREAAAGLPEPLLVDCDDRSRCVAGMGMSLVEDLTVGSLGNGGPGSLLVRRTAALVRRSDPEFLCLALPCSGEVVLSRGGDQAVLQLGHFTVYDTSRPYDGVCRQAPAGTNVAVLGVPRARLGPRADRMRRLAGTALSAPPGMVRLVQANLARVAADAPGYAEPEAAAVAGLLVDLLGWLLAAAEGGDPAPPPQRLLLLQRAKRLIDARLSDPDLSPAQVAAALHVSVRNLYRAFDTDGRGVAEWIRHRRLAGCRQHLLTSDAPVQSLAPRWGFPSAAQLSRAFRREYGLPPHAYRLAHRPRAAADDNSPAGDDNAD
jgi:AraC-like DNA-binding protein